MMRELGGIAGVTFCTHEESRVLKDRLGGSPPLPEEHVNALAEANGVTVFYGYFRLFGIGCGQCRDMLAWNASPTWRFAWPTSVNAYFMIGETAWGDQYAYSIDDLRRGGESVYLLDAFEMQAEEISCSFEEFFSSEFVRCATEPYDSMLKSAFAKFGALDWEKQITYIPSLLVGGVENIENVHMFNARVNMIINGDIATQVSQRDGRKVHGLENYVDEEGRLRTRVLWADE